MARPQAFDSSRARDAELYDELPLWSSLAGTLLLEHVPLDVRRALDLGCGTGFPLLELAERLGPGASVVGVDPWLLALKRARRKRDAWSVPQAEMVGGDGARLSFPDATFDLVTSNLGVNNFADADRALAECHRVLRPGGRLVLSSNVAGHMRELYEAFERVLADDPAALDRLRRHVAHRGTPASLSARLEAAGFRVTATHEREVYLRYATASAMFGHHFIRLGFLPAWEEVAGGGPGMARLRAELDRAAGEACELLLTIPLVCIVARRE